jgi:RNase P subunit RPR2
MADKKDLQYGNYCPLCDEFNPHGVYAIAQLAMGTELVGTCKRCGFQFRAFQAKRREPVVSNE